jgi:hypothetical protein
VNEMSGPVYGPLGAAVAAWPAVAMVPSYELLMIIVRRSSAPAPDQPAVPVPLSVAPAPSDRRQERRAGQVEIFPAPNMA